MQFLKEHERLVEGLAVVLIQDGSDRLHRFDVVGLDQLVDLAGDLDAAEVAAAAFAGPLGLGTRAT